MSALASGGKLLKLEPKIPWQSLRSVVFPDEMGPVTMFNPGLDLHYAIRANEPERF